MQYWLMKSEPSDVSIDDLSKLPNQTIEWYGIRNYQARNFMRDSMKDGDLALFWHSSCKEPGIYGIVKIHGIVHPDSYQFDPGSKYYDAKSTVDKPRWWCVDVKLVKKTKYISIKQLRNYPELSQMRVLQSGNRLSITPVSPNEWEFIYNLLYN
jgi:predicted RNA-binding protein with PUA-like domain